MVRPNFVPQSVEEYYDLVREAIEEAEELAGCIEDADDEEDWKRLSAFAGPLEASLKQLHAEMQSGSYRFPADSDLPFMPIVARHGADIPFRFLLEVINRIHRRGLG